jgi:hypothetical protein
VSFDHQISGYSFGNGIGDFNHDGELDYILPLGRYGGDIYIFPKTGPGNQFDSPIWVGSWNEGVYPGDLAIADFNGDGHLDFVLSYYYSPHCGLYLGDGDFGFTFTLLSDTKPTPAIGIDAHDFDNNGIVDFVIAPRSLETGLTVMGDISIDVSNMGHISSNVANAKTEFLGTGTIKAFEKKKGSFKKELWQQIMRFFSKGKSKHPR